MTRRAFWVCRAFLILISTVLLRLGSTQYLMACGKNTSEGSFLKQWNPLYCITLYLSQVVCFYMCIIQSTFIQNISEMFFAVSSIIKIYRISWWFSKLNTSLLTGKFSWKIVTMVYRNSNDSIQPSCGVKNSQMQTEDTWQIGNTSVIF